MRLFGDPTAVAPKPVFRENFVNFIMVDRDFANREQILASDYARTIAELDSARGVRRP
jgi:hypothetical protein